MAKDNVLKNKLLLAIRKKCAQCMSGNMNFVEKCNASIETGRVACDLHPYRKGPLTDGKVTVKEIKQAIKRNCQKCIGAGDRVENCTCNGSGGFQKCNLFDIRLIP